MRKGTTHSKESREKIAQAKLGKKFAPEHSSKIAAALTGKTKTPEHIQAIKEGIKASQLRRKEQKQISNEVLQKQGSLEEIQ